MECRDVVAALALGDESQPVLEHLAGCASCRTRSESTMFLDESPTDRRPPAFVRQRRLPWMITAALLPLVVVLAVVAVQRRRAREEPPASPPVARVVPVAPPAPVVTEEVPPPEPAKPVARRPVGTRALPLPRAPAAAHEAAPAKEATAAGEATAKATEKATEKEPDEPEDEAPQPVADRPSEAKPTGAPIAGGLGWLTITSEPWARVFLDGKDTGRTTPARITAPAGRHQVELRAASGRTLGFDVTVRPRETVEIDRTIE